MKIKKTIIVAVIIFALIAVGIGVWRFWPDETNKVSITGFGLSGGQNE